METIPIQDYNIIFNFFSFTVAVMFAATLFFWLNLRTISPTYHMAVVITGLVTLIAAYHYWQIFHSFSDAFTVDGDVARATGKQFNEAYRYVDWLLTVPLLMVELILVMKLSREETSRRAVNLGLAAAVMIALGYPGEVSGNMDDRMLWWVLSMIPFVYIVYQLFFGLRASIDQQPGEAKGLVRGACYMTIVAWLFYPIVYILPVLGLSTEGAASVPLQIGYSIADIVAKAVFGVLIFNIARRKSEAEGYKA